MPLGLRSLCVLYPHHRSPQGHTVFCVHPTSCITYTQPSSPPLHRLPSETHRPPCPHAKSSQNTHCFLCPDPSHIWHTQPSLSTTQGPSGPFTINVYTTVPLGTQAFCVHTTSSLGTHLYPHHTSPRVYTAFWKHTTGFLRNTQPSVSILLIPLGRYTRPYHKSPQERKAFHVHTVSSLKCVHPHHSSPPHPQPFSPTQAFSDTAVCLRTTGLLTRTQLPLTRTHLGYTSVHTMSPLGSTQPSTNTPQISSHAPSFLVSGFCKDCLSQLIT